MWHMVPQLRGVVPLEVAQGKEGPLALRQAVHQLPHRHLAEILLKGVDLQLLLLHRRLPGRLSDAVDIQVPGRLVQPRPPLAPAQILQAVQVAQGPQVGLLDQVLRRSLLPRNGSAVAQQLVIEGGIQLLNHVVPLLSVGVYTRITDGRGEVLTGTQKN